MTDNNPLVSVIIPVYNCEGFVEQAVRSIMNQTYKNLEIIVTDDCSTDGTYEILQKLADEDSRIKLFRNEQNLKIVKTLNNMVDLAQGKYIARMDGDDISLPKRIEKQVEFLEGNPNYGICGTNAYIINEYNKIIDKIIIPLSSIEINNFKTIDSPFLHPSVVILAKIMKHLKYNFKFQYAEDYELWLRVLKNNDGINLKDPLLLYRVVHTSISHYSKTKTVQVQLRNQLQTIDDGLYKRILRSRDVSLPLKAYVTAKYNKQNFYLFIYYLLRLSSKLIIFRNYHI